MADVEEVPFLSDTLSILNVEVRLLVHISLDVTNFSG